MDGEGEVGKDEAQALETFRAFLWNRRGTVWSRPRLYSDSLYRNGQDILDIKHVTGWVDNLNGPTGMIAGASKGVLRTLYCG